MATESQLESTVPDYVVVIHQLAQKLKLTKFTVSKAAILCHTFQTIAPKDTYKMKDLAAAAVSLGMKLNQENVPHRATMLALYEVLNDTTVTELADDSFEPFEKLMLHRELFLFKMCEGDTSHKVALEYLASFLKSIRNWDNMEEKYSAVCAHSAKLALKAYNCVECISFVPEAVAAAAVCISLDLFGVSKNHYRLCEAFCPFLNVKTLDDIMELLSKDDSFSPCEADDD